LTGGHFITGDYIMMWALLLAVAVIPGAFLAAVIYKMDKFEHEPPALIVKLLLLGAVSAVPTLIFELLLDDFISESFSGVLFLIIDNFLGTALIEEGFKLLFLKLGSWKNKAFDYQFDGIVYAVSVSLGYAILENVIYVFQGGFVTGILRAITIIPGHAIFGIYMGYYYGMAKYYDYRHAKKKVKKYMRLALFVPIILHGMYDTMASLNNAYAVVAFFVFFWGFTFFVYRKVKSFAASDRKIDQ